MPTSIDNLKDAFAGESQANQKYRAFAAKAADEGYPNIARLFRAAAEAERIHAEGHQWDRPSGLRLAGRTLALGRRGPGARS
jgi:rubrerythrin